MAKWSVLLVACTMALLPEVRAAELDCLRITYDQRFTGFDNFEQCSSSGETITYLTPLGLDYLIFNIDFLKFPGTGVAYIYEPPGTTTLSDLVLFQVISNANRNFIFQVQLVSDPIDPNIIAAAGPPPNGFVQYTEVSGWIDVTAGIFNTIAPGSRPFSIAIMSDVEVPEPGTSLLTSIGLAGAGWLVGTTRWNSRRRRRKALS